MRKAIIVYYLIIHIICLIPSLVSLFQLDLKFNTLFFFFYSLLNIISILLYQLNKAIKITLSFLILSNFFQIITFVFCGLSYKFLLGPEISFYIFNDGNLSSRFSALPYNVILYVNTFNLDSNFLFGINFIHFLLFLFFNDLLLKSKKCKS